MTTDRFVSDDPTGLPEQTTPLAETPTTLAQLALRTRWELLGVIPGPRLAARVTVASQLLDPTLLRRGVRMRLVFSNRIGDDTESMRHIADLIRLGAEARLSERPQVGMVILDRRAAVLTPDGGDPAAMSTVLNEPATVSALHVLFETIWNPAEPAGCGSESSATELTERERALLALLSGGLTDEAIANRLSVSLRTVRRMVANLMRRLGARSRFQAGQRAAEEGWL